MSEANFLGDNHIITKLKLKLMLLFNCDG